MGLYERILRVEEPKLPVHQLIAAMQEHRAGRLTTNQVRTAFNLTASEGQELITLRDRVVSGALTTEEVERVLYLAESGMFYATVALLKTRLGVA
jgi:hypothetical protein